MPMQLVRYAIAILAFTACKSNEGSRPGSGSGSGSAGSGAALGSGSGSSGSGSAAVGSGTSGSVVGTRDAAADPPCVAPDASPVMLDMARGKLSYCFELGNTIPRCFVLDVATATVAAAPSPKPLGQEWPVLAPDPAPARITITHADSGSKPRVCRAGRNRCMTLAMSHEIDQGMGLVDAENVSLTLAALASLQFVDTFDLRTGKRIASFETGPNHASCNSLEFANDTLVIGEASDCASPVYSAWLATPNGVKIADVGGDVPLGIGMISMEKLGGDRFAFASAGGDTVIYQDVKTGKVDQRVAVGAATSDGHAYLLGDGQTLAVIYAGTRVGDIALIDTATNKVTTIPGKRCKPTEDSRSGDSSGSGAALASGSGSSGSGSAAVGSGTAGSAAAPPVVDDGKTPEMRARELLEKQVVAAKARNNNELLAMFAPDAVVLAPDAHALAASLDVASKIAPAPGDVQIADLAVGSTAGAIWLDAELANGGKRVRVVELLDGAHGWKIVAASIAESRKPATVAAPADVPGPTDAGPLAALLGAPNQLAGALLDSMADDAPQLFVVGPEADDRGVGLVDAKLIAYKLGKQGLAPDARSKVREVRTAAWGYAIGNVTRGKGAAAPGLSALVIAIPSDAKTGKWTVVGAAYNAR